MARHLSGKPRVPAKPDDDFARKFAEEVEKLRARFSRDAEQVQELLGRWDQLNEDRPGLLGGNLIAVVNEAVLDEHLGRLAEAAAHGKRTATDLADYADFVAGLVREYATLLGVLATIEIDPGNPLAADWQKLSESLLEKAEHIERLTEEMEGRSEEGDEDEEERETGFGAGRELLARVWAKAKTGEALQGEEARLAQAMRDHPEYRMYWETTGPMPGKHSTIGGVNPGAHISMHAVVENQLAEGEPPETRQTLERLMASGLSRHDAVHRIANVVAKQVFRMLKEKREFDRPTFLRDLAKLK